MKLYVVRHGQTPWNLENKVQGVTDIPLTDKGREEALKLRELVAKLDIDIVISSPLKRALETAEILVDGKLPIYTDDRIVERNWGKNEGEILENVDRVVCWNVLANSDDREIEPVQSFMMRVSSFLEDLTIRYPDKNVLVVAHSAIVRVIHYLLEKIPEDGDLTKMDIPNLRILEYEIK